MFPELHFDNKLNDFINDTRNLCRISEILQHGKGYLLKQDGNFIKFESIDTISFIPKSKLVLALDGFSNTKYRTTVKVGRFISKFMLKEARINFNISDRDIEIFVNLFKSYFDTDTSKYKIVSGDEILDWYLYENYHLPFGHKHGSLWNSCMRYREKNSYMNIYAVNPEKVKMLVHINEDGKLRTRALLWEEVYDQHGNKFKVMDRIYSVYDYEVLSFKKWATDNNYIYKKEQSSKRERLFVTPDGTMDLKLKVGLDKWKIEYYPYIDTFKFLNYGNGVLSNNDDCFFDFILIQNDGSLEREEIESDSDF